MMLHAKIINALKIQTCTSPTNQAITSVRFRVQMKNSLLELENSNKNLHCSYAVRLHLLTDNFLYSTIPISAHHGDIKLCYSWNSGFKHVLINYYITK